MSSDEDSLMNHEWMTAIDDNVEPLAKSLEELAKSPPKPPVRRRLISKETAPEYKIVVEQPSVRSTFVQKMTLAILCYLCFLLTYIVYKMKDQVIGENKHIDYSYSYSIFA